MKYQNDPTKPNYNPSPQETFRMGYIHKYGFGLFISTILNMAHIFFTKELKSLNSLGIWFSISVSCIMLTYAIVNMVKFFSLKKNPEKLEELYRQYNDERNALIREKTSGGSFMASVYIICIAIVVFAYISTMVTVVLSGLLLAMLLVRLLLKMYYEKKY